MSTKTSNCSFLLPDVYSLKLLLKDTSYLGNSSSCAVPNKHIRVSGCGSFTREPHFIQALLYECVSFVVLPAYHCFCLGRPSSVQTRILHLKTSQGKSNDRQARQTNRYTWTHRCVNSHRRSSSYWDPVCGVPEPSKGMHEAPDPTFVFP